MPTFSRKSAKKILGFTLLEILVVMAIIGILASIGIASYGTVQAKARDARRKSDLENVARALEMYYNDVKSYPSYDASGNMVIGATPVAWGSNWSGYMEKLPIDERHGYYYRSESSNQSYRLFARMENLDDGKVVKSGTNPGEFQYESTKPGPASCGGQGCNYQISSSNLSVPTSGAQVVDD